MRTARSAFSRVLSEIVDFSTSCLSEHEVAERRLGALIATRIFGSLHWWATFIMAEGSQGYIRRIKQVCDQRDV